jgi:hypothetical protein
MMTGMVVRKASSAGVLTPPTRSLSPDAAAASNGQAADLNTLASRLMQEMGHHAQPPQSPVSDREEGEAVVNGGNGINGIVNGGIVNGGPHPLEALLREDKYLVERIVANLGRCVLGLTENGRASAESRMYRRRLDAARRALEGLGLEEI